MTENTSLIKLIMTSRSPTGFRYESGSSVEAELVGPPLLAERATRSGLKGERAAVESLRKERPEANAYAANDWGPTRTNRQFGPVYFLRIDSSSH